MTLDLGSIASTAIARHDATETIVGGDPATVIHDQTIRTGEARLAAELGLSDWLGVGAIVPFRLYNTSIRYLDPSGGGSVDIENPFVHHHDETLTGIGDPWIYGRAATSVGATTIGGRAGFTIPLGRTVPDPFALGDMGQSHEHSQFGTGTFDLIAGIEASRAVGSVRFDLSALTIQSIYANDHGYHAGDRYAASFGAASSLGTKRFRYRATIESVWETAESWGGVVHTDDGNLGRTDVLAGASLTWLATDDWHVGIDVKLPVYTRVVGGEVDALGFIGISVGTHVHLFGETEDGHGDHHDHDHAAAPADWTGLDKLDVAAAALVPVVGKITVADFWATWCEPCKDLDRELAALARAHPDDLAVRKVDVTADSGAMTLPYVKVFGRDGTLLWERHASPLQLAAAVGAAIAPSAKIAIPANAPRVAIDVDDGGFAPPEVAVERSPTTILVFTRKSDKTCATDVHFDLPDGTKRDVELPLGKAVEIAIPTDRPGRIDYRCGMNMNRGAIIVK